MKYLNSISNSNNISSLKHRVAIQRPVLYNDELGGFTIEWQEWRKVWALIVPITGSNYFTNLHKETVITHKVSIRYIPELKASMRLVYKDRIFAIKYVVDLLEANKIIEIMTEEKPYEDYYQKYQA